MIIHWNNILIPLNHIIISQYLHHNTQSHPYYHNPPPTIHNIILMSEMDFKNIQDEEPPIYTRHYGALLPLGHTPDGEPKYVLGPHCTHSPTQTSSSSAHGSSAPASPPSFSPKCTPCSPPPGSSSPSQATSHSYSHISMSDSHTQASLPDSKNHHKK